MTADPTHRYAVGDPDPTWPDAEGARACPALDADARYACTWPAGHAHPQHVAGDGAEVLAVWDATPPDDASTCQRCAQPAADRPTVTLERGEWMHYAPCWTEWDDMAAGADPDPAEPTVAAEHDADQRPGDRLPPRPHGVITDDTDVPETVKLRPIDDIPLPEPVSIADLAGLFAPDDAQAAPLDLATALRGLLMWERPAGDTLDDYADRIAATLIRSGIVPDPDAGWTQEYAVRVEWEDGRDWTSESYTRADAERAAGAFRPIPPGSSIASVAILTRRTRTETTPWQPVAAESPQEPRNR